MQMISTVFARKVLKVANDKLDKPALMKSFGIDAGVAPDLSEMMPYHSYYDLLEFIAEAGTNTDPFQLHAGASMRCDDYGALGLAWKSALDLRSTFERAVRYARLMTSVSTYEIRDDGVDAFFILNRVGTPRPSLFISNEATMASITSFSRELTQGKFNPKSVYFQHKAPNDISAYERYFSCPVYFESELNALHISGSVLAFKNRLGDVGVSHFLESHLDSELNKTQDDESIEHLVQTQISKALSSGVPKMADIAKRLGMSERTLHRRLGDHDLTYHSLVNQTRQELAESLLVNSDYALIEVAFLTGFSEQSAFQRAFKRWFKQTPAAFRKIYRSSN